MKNTFNIGPGLRAMRESADMSLKDVALLAGSSESYLSRIETCKVQPSKPLVGKVMSVIADRLVSGPLKDAA